MEFLVHAYAANTIVADVLAICITWASARMLLTKVWQLDKSTNNFHLILSASEYIRSLILEHDIIISEVGISEISFYVKHINGLAVGSWQL